MSKEADRYLERIVANADYMEQLINDLIRFPKKRPKRIQEEFKKQADKKD